LLFLTFLLAWIPLAIGADWPQWRGPDRNGVAPESPPLADEWPGPGPKLLWQIERLMHGGDETGHSSPVVAGGRVYLYGNWMDAKTPEGANDAVTCLNASTGALLWRSVFPADGQGEVRAHGSTPCVVNGRLYVAGRRRVYCLDAANGKLLWKQPIDLPVKSSGISCSFAVVDGIAILICQGFYGFDALTGQVRWRRTEAPGPWNSNGGWPSCPSAVVWRHEGKNYVVCSCKSVELLDPATGQAIWKIPWVEGGWSSWNGNSTPSIIGDRMVINQKAGGLEGYALSLEAPRKLWHIPDHDVATSPLIYQGNVYTIGGGDYAKTTSMKCADLFDGTVAWERNTKPQGASSPLAADGKIFGFLQFGRLLCMWKADPLHYTLLATTPVKADGYSSPAFANGCLYLRLLDGAACYDVTRTANPPASELADAARRRKLENQAKAFKYYRELADQGDALGEWRLGEMYRDGEGVARDLQKSREWLVKAANQGEKDAATDLSELPVQ